METCPPSTEQTFHTESLFLTHGELKYVKESETDQYFELGALGVQVPFRFYKNKAQLFLATLSNKTLPAALTYLSAYETRQLEDGTFSETALDESVDPNTGLRYRVNLVGQVFRGKPGIVLRSEVYLDNEKRFHPTCRQVKVAISQEEFENIKQFISEKLIRSQKKLYVDRRGGKLTDESRDPDDAPDSPDVTPSTKGPDTSGEEIAVAEKAPEEEC
jgi:hypothetical protein